MTMGFWQSQLPVGPWMTDALGLKATCSNPALQLLVIPGNPGLSAFYKVFMSELHSLFGGAADVWAVSNIGHDASNLTQGRVWCLSSQTQHKVALLKEHVLAAGKPPAVVIAHSIGSYMMLQAIKQLEEEQAAAGKPVDAIASKIPKVLLLMPFLATDWSSPRQHFLKLAARFAPVIGAGAGALGSLPVWLLDRLVGLAEPTAEPHTREAIRQLINRNGCRNNFHLAQHEFRDLDGPVDWEPIKRLGKRAALVCCPDDIWFPMHHYFDAQAAVPGMEEYYSTELCHAFCCHTKQCQLIAKLVHLSVRKAKALQGPGGSLITEADQQLEVATASSAVDVSVLLGDEQPDEKLKEAKCIKRHRQQQQQEPVQLSACG